MRRIREVLRLKYECEQKHRAISMATGLSKGSVSDYITRAKHAGVTWEQAKNMDERELEARLFRAVGRNEPPTRAAIDFGWVHVELRRPGVTLQRLWVEYSEALANDPEKRRPYGYSQFCDLYRVFRKKIDVSMRQTHRAGEKCFIDYSGKKLSIFDRETGEAHEVELFVAVLGASNYTHAEATRTQQLPDFVASTIRTLEFFGGVPQVIVPDQLRSAVSGPDRIDPQVNPTYAELAEHYGTAIIPARPRKPKDKAKVENAVLVVQRWILARLRDVVFFTLEDLNAAISALCDDLNRRPFRKLEGCRRSAFETIDQPALQPLPRKRYELSRWKKCRVNIDYHVEYDHRYYSVPHPLVGAEVWARATVSTVELLLDGKRVASHRRSYGPKGTAVTDEAHRPKAHQRYGSWPPSRIVAWAETIGPSAAEVVRAIMKSWRHPEQGYRSCMALIRDAKKYGPERTDAACLRALGIGSPTRKSVVAILKNGLDRVPLDEPEDEHQVQLPLVHENVRGGDYYATGPGPNHEQENDE